MYVGCITMHVGLVHWNFCTFVQYSCTWLTKCPVTNCQLQALHMQWFTQPSISTWHINPRPNAALLYLDDGNVTGTIWLKYNKRKGTKIRDVIVTFAAQLREKIHTLIIQQQNICYINTIIRIFFTSCDIISLVSLWILTNFVLCNWAVLKDETYFNCFIRVCINISIFDSIWDQGVLANAHFEDQ